MSRRRRSPRNPAPDRNVIRLSHIYIAMAVLGFLAAVLIAVL